MLTDADATVVKRDPELPGLGLVLDPDAIAPLVAKHWPDVDLNTLGCTYVRYKPGQSCLVAYQAELGRERVSFVAKCFRPQEPGNGEGCGINLPDGNVERSHQSFMSPGRP